MNGMVLRLGARANRAQRARHPDAIDTLHRLPDECQATSPPLFGLQLF
jgi:hypothetical protein